MPFTLPTPPSEDSIDNLDIDTSNGVILTEHASHNSATQVPSSASSIDASNTMHGNNFGTFLATDDSMLLELTEDEDQDMSDGGAALASSLSHEGHIQIDMDIFNAEAMEPNNLEEMPTDLVLADLYHAAPYIANYNPIYEPGEGLEDFESPLPVPPMPDAATTDLPAVMSEVSHQLQHIQDGQEHGDFDLSQAEHHELFMSHNQSTTSLLFNSPSPVSVAPVTQYGAGALVSSQSLLSAVASLAQAPNEAMNNWANASVMGGSSFGQTGLFNFPSHLPSSDAIWADDQESDADHNEVEDQINMNFGAFLLDWADQVRMMRRAKDRRYRGPAAHGIARYTTENDIDPVTITDLKGEKCDFQRIDWSELGVSRLEARQMRRQTYKNYTNLRYVNPPQWHVS
jgi:hypothetical protein